MCMFVFTTRNPKNWSFDPKLQPRKATRMRLPNKTGTYAPEAGPLLTRMPRMLTQMPKGLTRIKVLTRIPQRLTRMPYSESSVSLPALLVSPAAGLRWLYFVEKVRV